MGKQSIPTCNMRVLHIVRGLEIGGLENVVCHLVKGLAARDMECHVALLNGRNEMGPVDGVTGMWTGNLEHNGKWKTIKDWRNMPGNMKSI